MAEPDLLAAQPCSRFAGFVSLHADEVSITIDDARRLVDGQCPQWRSMPLSPAGHGTDNQMFRLGNEFLVRLPRRPGTAKDVAKEQDWLPRLAPRLPQQIPEPVFRGAADDEYPFAWSVLRWIDGAEPDESTVDDWAQFGRDLAEFVEALHGIDPGDARAEGALEWYRGRRLAEFVADGHDVIEQVRGLDGLVDLDVHAVADEWHRIASVPDPVVPDVLLHGDLRSANLLARDGKLAAVIDFGALNIGNPTAEHAAVWQLPRDARVAYRERLGVDDDSWQRARAWAIFVSLLAMPYYWTSWPEFARSGIDTINTVLGEPR
ncbi:aminoglycoside phosphotransferase (APT) family kinase protein [Calidifontibacter indicus]|uniref:Aminoglycoside phosphotransferase (APT) family kinase protein n=2 Tax=Calidifontibacter indicus TaxID=419650 RepID=A0A3D9UPD0_9MICO|nr:aminoglycoside phosphotransferase (APT) family kinase protein [Calidifontibacter indicus]